MSCRDISTSLRNLHRRLSQETDQAFAAWVDETSIYPWIHDIGQNGPRLEAEDGILRHFEVDLAYKPPKIAVRGSSSGSNRLGSADCSFPEFFVSQISPVCMSLAEALIGDPFYRAVTIDSGEDEARRQIVLAEYFNLAIAEAQGIGEVQYADTDGAALWHTNEASNSDIEIHVAARKQALAKLLGARGFDNYLRISESMAEHVPHQLFEGWYLSILGVRPQAQGKRLAQRLLEITLSRADRQDATCFLETFNPLSLPFYRRLGFTDEIHCFEKVTGRDYWILARHPIHGHVADGGQ